MNMHKKCVRILRKTTRIRNYVWIHRQVRAYSAAEASPEILLLPGHAVVHVFTVQILPDIFRLSFMVPEI
jgi:hypothetical protein